MVSEKEHRKLLEFMEYFLSKRGDFVITGDQIKKDDKFSNGADFMITGDQIKNDDKFSNGADFMITGDQIKKGEKYIFETHQFQEYQITTKLTKDRKFVSIENVKIDKNFYNYRDLIKSDAQTWIPYPDVSEE